MGWHAWQWRNIKMDKVDKMLQEIYLEMEVEDLEDKVNKLQENILSEAPPYSASGGIQLLKNHLKDLMGMKTDLKYKIAKLAPGDDDMKRRLFDKLNKIDGQIAGLKSKIAKGAAGALEKGQQVAGDVGKGAKELGHKIASSDAGKAVSKAAGQAGEKITQAASAAKDLAAAHPGAAAAVGAIAAVAAAVAIYKKFFSQAARACKGKSGPDKKNCVNSFKAKGLQAAKAKVMSGMSKCKDPKCKAKLQSKAQGFDAKIRALKGGMAESMIDSYVGDYISEIKDLLEKDSKN
jgi:hypothetical protein